MIAAMVPIVVGTVAIIIGSYSPGSSGRRCSPWQVLLGSLGLTVLAALIWRMPGGAHGYVKDASASLFTIGYIPLLGSFSALILAGRERCRPVVTFMLSWS